MVAARPVPPPRISRHADRNARRIGRALLSVSTRPVCSIWRPAGRGGVEIVSTGGTRKTLADAGVPVKDVSDLTGFPEIMDGRVKTLHPKVHGGLLGVRLNPEHQAAMYAHGIAAIDLLVVQPLSLRGDGGEGRGFAECIENIDIGGPAMIRAAAKNHDDVAVIVDPADYGRCFPTWRPTRSGDAHAPPQARAEGLRPHRRLRRRHLQLVRRAAGRARPALARRGRPAGGGHALRREPAPSARLLPRAGPGASASPPRASCRASSSPTTT